MPQPNDPQYELARILTLMESSPTDFEQFVVRVDLPTAAAIMRACVAGGETVAKGVARALGEWSQWPRAWTRAEPEAPGYYWHRATPEDAPKVIRLDLDPYGRLAWQKADSAKPPEEVPDGEWCGPIRPPTRGEDAGE
jgi:hypothetical protein